MFRQSLRIYQNRVLNGIQILSKPQFSWSKYIRKFSTDIDIKHPVKSNAQITSKEDWIAIYRYDNILMVSVISNLKSYQAIGGSLLTMTFGIGELAAVLPTNSTLCIGVMVIVSQIGLCLFSFLFTNSIGFIHVCPKIENIRFAYINFWGKRLEMEVPIKDLEIPKGPKFLLMPIMVNKKKLLILHPRGSTYLQPDIVKHIFKDIGTEVVNDDEKEKPFSLPRNKQLGHRKRS